MELLTLIVCGVMNALCFFLGAKVGQKVIKGEYVEMPNINPMEAYRQHQSRKEEERMTDRNEAILRNIDMYNGTGIGQIDVPGGKK